YQVQAGFDPFPNQGAGTATGDPSLAGINVAAGNLQGDAFDEVLVGQLRNAQSLVAAFDVNGDTFSQLGNSFSAYDSGNVPPDAFKRGAFVAAATGIRATQLAVTTQPPVSVQAGTPFGLTVTVEDANGVVDATYNGTVSLNIQTGPGGAAPGGTTKM